tara:strand:+ start:128 stop:595 length:468 start_codon:yes stop_codon:yes gene_type:complete
MPEEKEYLTQEKFDEFQAELEVLKHEKRQEIARNLEYAKSLGDLSENAEYHAAREAQAKLEDRIQKLTELLKNAEIISHHDKQMVGAGSIVTIKKKGSKTTFTYTLVGSEEADMSAGKISNKSPIGSALVGKKKGEEFTVTTPVGDTVYIVESIK